MGVSSYKDLIQHVGHDIVCVTYGSEDVNVAIECQDCGEVLVDYDKPRDLPQFDRTEEKEEA